MERPLIDTKEKHRKTELHIEPTGINFKGSDEDNPVVCSHFGCKTILSKTEQLFGKNCIDHQKVKNEINRI